MWCPSSLTFKSKKWEAAHALLKLPAAAWCVYVCAYMWILRMGERVEVEINSEVVNGMPSELKDAPEAMRQFPGVQQRNSVLSQRKKILNPLLDPGASPTFLGYKDSRKILACSSQPCKRPREAVPSSLYVLSTYLPLNPLQSVSLEIWLPPLRSLKHGIPEKHDPWPTRPKSLPLKKDPCLLDVHILVTYKIPP